MGFNPTAVPCPVQFVEGPAELEFEDRSRDSDHPWSWWSVWPTLLTFRCLTEQRRAPRVLICMRPNRCDYAKGASRWYEPGFACVHRKDRFLKCDPGVGSRRGVL